MKKYTCYLLICFLLTLVLACYQPTCDCQPFKTGTFQVDLLVNGKQQVAQFTRTDSLEIETFQGKTDTAMVRWVNDCEYIVRKKNPKTMEEKKAIGIKIVHTTPQSYTFEFGVVGSDVKQKATAIKL